jgi:Zn finger protein HypA/HybF involved in hydrogenase expression
MSSREYIEGSENYDGLCLSCGAVQHGVEPDAERYTCESCGRHAVIGFEQALLVGALRIEGLVSALRL